MDALTDRAARAAHRHPAAALPLSELSRLVQESGTRVSDDVLLRALLTEPARFRIVDPWKGPWARLRSDRRTGRHGSLAGAGDRRVPNLVDGPRVVPAPGAAPWSPGPAGPALGRMRQALIRLGWRVDDASPVDLARWHRLVLEGQRARNRLTAR